MKGKKKKSTQTEEQTIVQFLQSFEENHMIDDHGHAIIGARNKKVFTNHYKRVF